MRKRADENEAEALAAKARLEHFLSSSSGVVFCCNPANGYMATYVSSGIRLLLGYDPRDFLEDPGVWLEKVHPDDRDEILAMLKYVFDVGHLIHEFRMKREDGTYRWLRDEMRISRDREGRPKEIIGYWMDITDHKSLEDQLLHDAFHDKLSNLPNRALFMDRLGISLARIQRRKKYLFAVLFIDLDRFKNVNDSLGHMKGDHLLGCVAKRLLRFVRFGDTVARLGGDEFAMILEDLENESDAEKTAQRIQHEISQPYNLGGKEVFTTASIGIALANPRYQKPEHLLRDADTAMYRAKASGRARHAVFDESMRDQAVTLLELDSDLRRAVERSEFLLHYQPIVKLSTGEVIGFEALLRWKHPVRGIINPCQFIPLAEDTGLIIPIGQWSLQEACRQAREWQKRFPQSPPLAISVNLSNKQLMPGFARQVRDILRETGLDPSSLDFEITESMIIDNTDWAARLFKELRGMNVRVFIDDFGTGYSSMNYLGRLPVDGLKIDRSFIKGIDSSEEGLEIVRTILTLARNLGLDVIAEGVETAEQMEMLRQLNGQYAQGFYFHRPMEGSRIGSVLGLRPSKVRSLP
ncbi:MAG TPA: EAL domain-containing protein [Candidatus Aminicenantes bacterium]|nr:EAL domain-containing protein [Candidatus Aminicenantes bacterium]